jgi:CheY-like chemotaxis protein
MNGTISVTSTPRKGSKFTVVIPLQLSEAGIVAWKEGAISTNREAMGAAVAIDPGKPLVLLVDDYKPNVLVAGTLLENLGYRYEVASNGKKALKKLESRHFDIILMDVQMQEMDGLQTTRHIRKLEKKKNLPRMPIIAMTAHALADDRERCLKAGMDDYISKPFNPKELQEKLEHFAKYPAAV